MLHEAMQGNRTTNSTFFQLRTTTNSSSRTFDQSNLPRFQYIIESSHKAILDRIGFERKSKLNGTIIITVLHFYSYQIICDDCE